MSQTIEITVSPKGETRIETKGFSGSACRDASKTLEAALGVRVTQELTSEFHTTAATQQSQSQRQ